MKIPFLKRKATVTPLTLDYTLNLVKLMCGDEKSLSGSPAWQHIHKAMWRAAGTVSEADNLHAALLCSVIEDEDKLDEEPFRRNYSERVLRVARDLRECLIISALYVDSMEVDRETDQGLQPFLKALELEMEEKKTLIYDKVDEIISRFPGNPDMASLFLAYLYEKVQIRKGHFKGTTYECICNDYFVEVYKGAIAKLEDFLLSEGALLPLKGELIVDYEELS